MVRDYSGLLQIAVTPPKKSFLIEKAFNKNK